MVQTITPAVHGGRTKSYWKSVALHTLGAALASAALGITLGAIGMIGEAVVGSVGAAALLSLASAYLVRETFGIPVPIPQRRGQVPEWWRTFFSPGVAAFLYGAGLGTGFLTLLAHGTFVVVAAAAVLSGDPLTGALLCLPFGAARGLSVAIGAGSSDGGIAVAAKLEGLRQTAVPRAVNATALALFAALFAVRF